MKTSLSIHVLIFAFVLSTISAWALVDEDKLKALEYDINSQAVQKVNKAVTPDFIIAKYKIKTPILPPRLDKSQVEALVSKEVELRVEGEFPKSRYKEIEKNAKEKYRMYKIGDLVTLRVMDARRGVTISVTKHIRKITSKGVMMGDVFYIFQDINPSEYPHFFKTKHNKAVEREIQMQTNLYKRQRKEYEDKVFRKLAPKIWRDEGYIYRPSKREWVPREEVFNYLYQKHWIEKYEEVRKDIEILVLEQNGFTWNEALQQWEVRGAEEETVAEEQPKKTISKSLSNWSQQIKSLFKDEGEENTDKEEEEEEDLWGEGDEGDAQQE